MRAVYLKMYFKCLTFNRLIQCERFSQWSSDKGVNRLISVFFSKRSQSSKTLSAKQAASLCCQLGSQALNTGPVALMICFTGHIRTEI